MKLTRLLIAATLAFSLACPLAAQDAKPPGKDAPKDGAKKKGPPPGGKKGGLGGPSQESPEMQALLKSFNLTPEQQAKYADARAETSKKMREISAGKNDGTMPINEVLKQALASHKAFNAAVKKILSPEQYAKWEPLRESDHHKVAQKHKERDAAAAKTKGEKEKSAGAKKASVEDSPKAKP